MSLACKTLASFLLIFILSPKGTALTQVQGILNQDINLPIPVFPPDSKVDDIQWFRNQIKVARFREDKIRFLQNNTYQLSKNGTLKIRHLQRNDSSIYKVVVYNMDGKEIFTETFDLRILERVSRPEIFWGCTNKTLTCEVTDGTDPKLALYRDGKRIKEGQNIIIYKWPAKQNALFECMATNKISEETNRVNFSCSEKGLDIYLIIGICGGGILFLLFVALLTLYISKRRRARRRRNDEEPEIRVHKMTSEERSQKPLQMPASALQNPASPQPPPLPSHHPKAHGHRPQPPGHRAQPPHQHQQQKRPLPRPSTQARQQKGPPLPKPRVQPKPPRGAAENS
ncbi:T-cell surface antigen CD2 [Pteronotus mesoamericanus]|uniref:T-cell surface antigen CD2 n=1 Tax=Pteronotus mesoamericanus TaxID=1884717 RepID=UPI0023EA8EBC|nr:T-cell surface antigen CD2 [Pteronotus parnellii mesoamericanus]